jgi:hypothetical protein
MATELRLMNAVDLSLVEEASQMASSVEESSQLQQEEQSSVQSEGTDDEDSSLFMGPLVEHTTTLGSLNIVALSSHDKLDTLTTPPPISTNNEYHRLEPVVVQTSKTIYLSDDNPYAALNDKENSFRQVTEKDDRTTSVHSSSKPGGEESSLSAFLLSELGTPPDDASVLTEEEDVSLIQDSLKAPFRDDASIVVTEEDDVSLIQDSLKAPFRDDASIVSEALTEEEEELVLAEEKVTNDDSLTNDFLGFLHQEKGDDASIVSRAYTEEEQLAEEEVSHTKDVSTFLLEEKGDDVSIVSEAFPEEELLGLAEENDSLTKEESRTDTRSLSTFLKQGAEALQFSDDASIVSKAFTEEERERLGLTEEEEEDSTYDDRTEEESRTDKRSLSVYLQKETEPLFVCDDADISRTFTEEERERLGLTEEEEKDTTYDREEEESRIGERFVIETTLSQDDDDEEEDKQRLFQLPTDYSPVVEEDERSSQVGSRYPIASMASF